MARKKKFVGEDGKEYIAKEKKPFYKKVWFWILIVIVIAAFGNSLGKETTDKNTESTNNVKEAESVVNETNSSSTLEQVIETDESSNEEKNSSGKTAEQKYQAILDEYTKKIKDAVPGLVQEYNNEAANNQGGVEGLATISNEKVAKLAEISNEGVTKMAEVHLTSGSGKYENYEDWATKLTDVYMSEAQAITDAYMASAQ